MEVKNGPCNSFCMDKKALEKSLAKQFPGLNEKALQIALARHAAVVWMEAQAKAGLSREACYRQASEMEWNGRCFGQSTLERYWKWYREDGFERLLPQGREDAGKSRALSPELIQLLEERRRKNPQQSVKELVRELIREGILKPADWRTLPSIYRYVRRAGLDCKTLAKIGTTGPTKAFEVAHVNDLWMSDVMYGPNIKTADGKTIATRLIAVIDDASRVIAFAEYRETEQEEDLWYVLFEAMKRRGVPSKLYTDNGRIFTSVRTQATCARLGIKLIHAKPYAAWSKGKVERLFLTIQQQFESRLKQNPLHDLAKLNVEFWRWIEREYHSRPHGGLAKDQSPRERFMSDPAQLRLLGEEELERYFWQQEERRVRRDATVSWAGRQWEVPVFLRGQKITILYNPLKKDQPIQVWHDKKLCGTLIKLDRKLNSRRINGGELYE